MNKKALVGWIIIIILVLAGVGGWFVYDSVRDKIDEVECNVDKDCPVITCITAPCPQEKCIDNVCEVVESCEGVALDQVQGCCDDWAEKNEISHVACVGGWVVEGGECGWVCG